VPAEGPREPAARPATARLFFALWPPAAVAQALGVLAADVARQAGGRATRPETIHLTLAFLGDVPLARQAELEAVARGVDATPFDLTIDRCGLWTHNRIFWAACGQPPAALGALAGTLAAALAAAGFLASATRGRFMPHVTLVRRVALPAPPLPACPPQAWPCQRFVLVRSMLTNAGSSYRVLAEFPLPAGAPGGLRPGESGP
jgi:2'-5' RNA ligase